MDPYVHLAALPFLPRDSPAAQLLESVHAEYAQNGRYEQSVHDHLVRALPLLDSPPFALVRALVRAQCAILLNAPVAEDERLLHEEVDALARTDSHALETLFLALVLLLRLVPALFTTPPLSPPLALWERSLQSSARALHAALHPPSSDSASSSSQEAPLFQKFRRSEFQDITFVTRPISATRTTAPPASALMGSFRLGTSAPSHSRPASALASTSHGRGRRRRVREESNSDTASSAAYSPAPPTSPESPLVPFGFVALQGVPRSMSAHPHEAALIQSAPPMLGRLSLSDPRRSSAFTEVAPGSFSRARAHPDMLSASLDRPRHRMRDEGLTDLMDADA